jgi:hypothetical protein
MKRLALMFVVLLLTMGSCSSNKSYPDSQTSTPTPKDATNRVTATTTPLSTTITPLNIPPDPNEIFEAWLQGDSGCIFPCWAGIIPGKTNWDDAINILSDVVTLHDTFEKDDCRYGECKSASWQYTLNGEAYSGIIYEKENLVHSISIGSESTSIYALREVFIKYGRPNQILTSASSYTPEGSPLLEMILLYEDRGFVIRYMWWGEIKDDEILACGQPSNFSLGIVDTRDIGWTSIEITQTGRQLSLGAIPENFLPVNDASRLSEFDIYELGLRPEQEFCISTFLSYWQ